VSTSSHANQPEDLLERLGQMERLLEGQQALLRAQQAELAQQRERYALLEARTTSAQPLESALVAESTLPVSVAHHAREAIAAAMPDEEGALPAAESPPHRKPARSSRRMLLKLGGAAAASVAATAALVAGEGSQTAHAADGGSLLIGTANTGTSQTKLSVSGTSSDSPFFEVNASGSTNSSAVAIQGLSNVASGAGVYGFSSGGTGVSGASTSGNGVRANSANQDALFASGGRYGVAAQGGTAQLWLLTPGSAGAPTTGAHVHGEIFADANAILWICIVDGTPGTWVRVATVPNGTVGGVINYLSTPVRLLDARTSPGTALVTRAPLGGNEIYAFTVAGLGGSGIPASAQGLIANVTVLGPSSIGNLSLFPAPGPGPSVASMTFGTPGLFLANGVNVGIGTAGQIMIQNQSSGTTPLVLDAVAFVS
jgi:hypothetical protein